MRRIRDTNSLDAACLRPLRAPCRALDRTRDREMLSAGGVPATAACTADTWSGARMLALGLHVVVGQHAQRRAVHVLILTAAQRPEERREPGEAERERHRDEIHEHVHGALAGVRMLTAHGEGGCLPVRTRSALSVTRIEEPDIAAAAISGVA